MCKVTDEHVVLQSLSLVVGCEYAKVCIHVTFSALVRFYHCCHQNK